jgi:undecaprenyl diphosphate synthase
MTEFMAVEKPGILAPTFESGAVPKHVAIVMDGNGRWANSRGLTRIEGHKAGEAALLDVVAGALEAGVKYLTVYAFSTENWKRSPEEVRFLMGFNREVLRRRRDQLNHWGVRIRWAGRRPKLWSTVISELEAAEKLTEKNSKLVLTMCVNYGSRIEMIDAINQMSEDIESKKLKPGSITERTISKYLNSGYLPDVDLFIRSSGEQRISNFLLWQSAYAEFVFIDTPWPDFDRTSLWSAISNFSSRNRRFGGAVDKPAKTGKN